MCPGFWVHIICQSVFSILWGLCTKGCIVKLYQNRSNSVILFIYPPSYEKYWQIYHRKRRKAGQVSPKKKARSIVHYRWLTWFFDFYWIFLQPLTKDPQTSPSLAPLTTNPHESPSWKLPLKNFEYSKNVLNKIYFSCIS